MVVAVLTCDWFVFIWRWPMNLRPWPFCRNLKTINFGFGIPANFRYADSHSVLDYVVLGPSVHKVQSLCVTFICSSHFVYILYQHSLNLLQLLPDVIDLDVFLPMTLWSQMTLSLEVWCFTNTSCFTGCLLPVDTESRTTCILVLYSLEKVHVAEMLGGLTDYLENRGAHRTFYVPGKTVWVTG